jgi:hypothetical protein
MANMKKILMYYLSGYLLGGGLGFAFLPNLTLKIMQSNVMYDEPIVRLAGLLMAMLGGLIGFLVYNEDYIAYKFSILARTILVIFLVWLWFRFDNPLFVVIEIIVLIGLIPSYIVLVREFRRSSIGDLDE